MHSTRMSLSEWFATFRAEEVGTRQSTRPRLLPFYAPTLLRNTCLDRNQIAPAMDGVRRGRAGAVDHGGGRSRRPGPAQYVKTVARASYLVARRKD